MKKLVFRALLLAVASIPLAGCNNGDTPKADSEKVVDYLIFEEISYVGTWKEKQGIATGGYMYDHDAYIKIHNPSKEVKYLDGLLLAVSSFSSNAQLNLRPGTDYRNTHVGVRTILRFPGSGQQYAVQPGQSVTLAAQAVDHTKDRTGTDEEDEGVWNANSYDLSNVSFQWFNEDVRIAADDFPDEDINKAVPYMQILSPEESKRIFFTLVTGRELIALIKPEVSIEDFLSKQEYKWVTSWTSSDKDSGSGKDGGHSHNGNGAAEVYYYRVPNEWVIDAVALCPKKEFKWRTVAETVDKGWTSVIEHRGQDKFKASAGLSLFRKHDGKKYVDTNDSSVDFEVRPSSLRKEK